MSIEYEPGWQSHIGRYVENQRLLDLSILKDRELELTKQLADMERKKMHNDSPEIAHAIALWCRPGKHAFDPDDSDAETFVRKGKGSLPDSKFTVCGEHLGNPFGASDMPAIDQSHDSDE